MAKKHQTDNPLFRALTKKYEADIAHASATLQIYFDNNLIYKLHMKEKSNKICLNILLIQK